MAGAGAGADGSSVMRLLDLFCGAGGAAMGYHQAGFDVVGVDIKPQPRYPFEFHQTDAMTFPLDGFDVIHASPPCQRYSAITHVSGNRNDHPDLIAKVRRRLRLLGLPYVIENVVGAPLHDPVLVCARMFDLRFERYVLRRHRLFESNVSIVGTGCHCAPGDGPTVGIYGGGNSTKPRLSGGGRPYKASRDEAGQIMGTPWMLKTEMNEAIPPAYTEFIGAQVKQLLVPP